MRLVIGVDEGGGAVGQLVVVGVVVLLDLTVGEGGGVGGGLTARGDVGALENPEILLKKRFTLICSYQNHEQNGYERT